MPDALPPCGRGGRAAGGVGGREQQELGLTVWAMESTMNDHCAIVDQYLKAEFPGASIVDDHDTERHGHWWSITQGDAVMVFRVSQEFLAGGSEDVARLALTEFDVARALRECAGRAVILTDRLEYQPEEPA
jgi:hypothetical protein